MEYEVERGVGADGVFDFMKRNHTGQMVLKFLNLTESENKELIRYIQKKRNELHGPKLVSIGRIQRTLGPEKGMLHPESKDLFRKRTDEWVRKFKNNFRPFPLIAELDGETYLLLDGNHTFEALKRIGRKKCWVIFYAGDKVHKLQNKI